MKAHFFNQFLSLYYHFWLVFLIVGCKPQNVNGHLLELSLRRKLLLTEAGEHFKLGMRWQLREQLCYTSFKQTIFFTSSERVAP